MWCDNADVNHGQILRTRLQTIQRQCCDPHDTCTTTGQTGSGINETTLILPSEDQIYTLCKKISGNSVEHAFVRLFKIILQVFEVYQKQNNNGMHSVLKEDNL